MCLLQGHHHFLHHCNLHLKLLKQQKSLLQHVIFLQQFVNLFQFLLPSQIHPNLHNSIMWLLRGHHHALLTHCNHQLKLPKLQFFFPVLVIFLLNPEEQILYLINILNQHQTVSTHHCFLLFSLLFLILLLLLSRVHLQLPQLLLHPLLF